MAALDLPTDHKRLVPAALEIINQCRASVGMRSAACRQIHTIVEAGRTTGERAIINKLGGHLDRLASHLFSPTELAFSMDAETPYDEMTLDRMKVAARLLTRQWERNNTDMRFGQGVYEALKYGACFLKQWPQEEGADRHPRYYSTLVMPWQFGVYNESVNDLNRQPAMVETTVLTLPEVWRRIAHLPEATVLFDRIKNASSRGATTDEGNSFFHDVMSTSTMDTSGVSGSPSTSGGIVSLTNDPTFAVMGPQLDVPLVKMHELWVWGDDDWVTIQIIEPDILLTRYKRTNLLIPGDMKSGVHPYTLIQPNVKWGYFWGRSEIADLVEPQSLLARWCDDAKRLFGLQVDKILGFEGYDGDVSELMDQFRASGAVSVQQGAKINDLTPAFPPEALTMIRMMMDAIDMIGGFDNQLSGKGEPGVRASEHADQLIKMAAPRLRDRSLLVERQCAMAADLTFSLMRAKEPDNYWTDARKIPDTRFTLMDVPDDVRVSVDSHSSSPVFKDNHLQLVMLGAKLGIATPHYIIDTLDFPRRETLHSELRKREEREAALKQQLLQQDPETLAKLLQPKKR